MYDERLEKTIASILFHNQELIKTELVEKDDFFTDIKNAINRMNKLSRNDRIIDETTVGKSFPIPLQDDVNRFEELVASLKVLNQERKLQLLPKVVTNLVLDKISYDEKIIKFRELVDRLHTGTGDVDDFLIGNQIDEYRDILLNGDTSDHVRTGINCLDAMLGGGARNGELIVVAGEPGGFKSTLMYNIAFNVALMGEPVLIFSYEVDRNEMIEVFASMYSRINSLKLKTKFLEPNELSKVTNTLSIMEELPIYLVDNNSRLNDIKLMGMQKKPKIVLVDYLQIMPDIGKETVSNLEYITRQFKQFTNRNIFNCPVVLLSQFSRPDKGEGGVVLERNLADLKGSSAIEQNANVVMFTKAVDIRGKDKDGRTKEAIQIRIAKHRHGELSTYNIPLDRTTHFINPDSEGEEVKT